jgi:hypothetical protein
MQLLDLPAFSWVKDRKDVKILRHKDTSQDLWALYAHGRFGAFQEIQSWDVFGDAKFVLSFIAERQKYARFVGAWALHSKSSTSTGLKYDTAEIPGYDDLKARLVVSWGEGTRSWAQWLHRTGNKKIFELSPPNYVRDFPGFYNFMLTYSELRALVQNPESNREWHRMLSSISGVYLILDSHTGLQYVGSASGLNGVWSRWSTYAQNPAGGNKLLKELLDREPSAAARFQYSILRVLEAGATRDSVLEQEALLKRKLGSRAFGLNC